MKRTEDHLIVIGMKRNRKKIGNVIRIPIIISKIPTILFTYLHMSANAAATCGRLARVLSVRLAGITPTNTFIRCSPLCERREGDQGRMGLICFAVGRSIVMYRGIVLYYFL
jgi:hypothetical protein